MIRLTARGLGLATVAVILLIAAGVTGLRPLAWPAGLLLGLVAAATLLAWLSARRAWLRRRLSTDRVAAGASVPVRLELSRDSIGLGAWGYLEDAVPPGLGGAPVLPVPSGWGHLETQLHYSLGTFLRGRYRIGPCQSTTLDPLGLASARRRLGGRNLLTVTPAVHPIGATAAGAGTGLVGEATQRRSSVLGPDDALIREYRPRDELRRIHWPSTAHTGTLMVRREEHAWEPSALILLDNRGTGHVGAGPTSSFEWAVSAAASVGAHLIDAGYDVTLSEADGRRLTVAGDTTRESLLDHLTDSTLTDAEDLADALRSDGGGRAELLIAIIGRLTRADAVALTTLRRHGALCRAILLQPTEPGPDDPADILLANGWRVVRDAAACGIPQAWAALADEVPR